MKILQVIYSLSSGGAERFTVELSNSLAASGHDVTLCVIRDLDVVENRFYRPLLNDNVALVELKIHPGLSLAYWIRLARVISRIDPDIVHCHLEGVGSYMIGIRWMFPKKRFIQTIHNDAKAQSQSLLDYLTKKIAYKLNYIEAVTISGATTRSFVDFYGCPPKAEIYNGRSALEKSPMYACVAEELSALKRNSDDLIFLHAGRCATQKNQEMLVSVFQRLIREGEHVVLIILGSGFDSEMGQSLRARLTEGIYILGARSNIGDYFFVADAFCLTSHYEGLPITVLEALCCGCPSICTPVGGIVDVIEDGVTGFLSDSTAEESYYAAVRRFIRLRGGLKKEVLADRFNQNYSMDKCASSYQELYQR